MRKPESWNMPLYPTGDHFANCLDAVQGSARTHKPWRYRNASPSKGSRQHTTAKLLMALSWGILGENYELSPVKGSSAAWRVTCAITYKQQNVFFLVGLREHFRHAVIACTLIEEGGKGRSRAIKRGKKKKINLFTALCCFSNYVFLHGSSFKHNYRVSG